MEPDAAAPPPYALHPVNSVGLATFLGSPLAGAIILGLNYRRLGQVGAAWRTVFVGAAATAAVIALAFVLPEKVPNALVWIPQILLVLWAAKSLQGATIEKHEAAGGRIASLWTGGLVGGACLLALLAGIFAWAFSSPPFPGEKINVFEADEIYYSGDTTEADARKLGDVLKELGYLGGAGSKTVHLDRTDGHVSVGLVLVERWDDPDLQTSVRALGVKIAAAGFGSPLTMNLHDQTGDLRNSVRGE